MAYEASSPELAQEVVEQLIQIFLAEHLRVNSTPRSLQFFEAQSAEIKDQLDKANESLRAAKDRFSLASIEGQRRILETQIGQIGQDGIDTGTALSSSHARSAAWRKELKDLPAPVVRQFVKGLPAETVNSMREQLFTLQAQEQELAAELTEAHPRLIATRRRVRMVEELLKGEQPNREQAVSAVVLAEHVVERGLVARRETIDSQRRALSSQLAELNGHEVHIIDLNRKVELLEAKYRTYIQSMEQARIDGELERQQITNISVIQPPSFIAKPTSPKKAFSLLAGLAFSAVSALALIILSDQLNSSFKSVTEIEEGLGEPVLVTLPQRHARRRHTIGSRPPTSGRHQRRGNNRQGVVGESGGELFHSLLRNCRWPTVSSGHPLETIGFTSCFPGEGASSFAVNCALAAAATGDRQVLLVDNNWFHPTLHETFNVEQSPGIAEFLRARDGILEVQTTAIPNLSLLTAGDRGDSPFSDGGSAERLQAFIETVTNRFDLVIFDMAPIGHSNGVMPLLTCVDGVVLVMEMDRVPKEAAMRVTQQLKRSGARLLGIALNKHGAHTPRWFAHAAT